MKNLTKLRVGATAFPNHDKEKTAVKLRIKIEEAKKLRTSNSALASATSSSDSSGKKPKKSTVLKKPPPNFGGGKLGSC